MQNETSKIYKALANSASGPYALMNLRELLIAELNCLPPPCKYKITNELLPLGKPIHSRSRKLILGMLSHYGKTLNRTTDCQELIDFCNLLDDCKLIDTEDLENSNT